MNLSSVVLGLGDHAGHVLCCQYNSTRALNYLVGHGSFLCSEKLRLRGCEKVVGVLVRIYLTGRVVIEGAGIVDQADLPGPRGRVLLAVLASSRGPVSRGLLAEILWDANPPEFYERSLNPLLSRLRGALEGAGAGRERLLSSSGSVELRRTADLWIDVEAAISALDMAEGALRRENPGTAWPQAAVATSILRRPFLEGVDLNWVVEQRRTLGEMLVRAYEVAADVWLALGDSSQAVVAARQLLAADPLRETSHVRLIRAHAAAGIGRQPCLRSRNVSDS